MQGLTTKQRRILDFITSTIKDRRFCPTLREIGHRFNVSVGTARDQTQALVAKGFLEQSNKGRARAFTLVHSEEGLPIVGRVGAGSGVIAQEDIEGHLTLGALAGKTDFLLRVKGDSMDAVGILEGDLVQVRKQTTASDGEIVVAVTEDEGVVKRLRKHADGPQLESANPKYPPIRREFNIVGRVVGLVRRYDGLRSRFA